MRVNCRKTLNAWLAGRALRPARSIWTDGQTIYSYGTAIVRRNRAGETIFNATRYSVTTSIHQNALAAALNVDVVTGGVRIGTQGFELEAQADAYLAATA